MRAWSADFAAELELEILALPNVADAGVAHRVQRVGDGLTLRVEDRRFQGDEDSCFHLFLLCWGPTSALRFASGADSRS